MKCLYYIRFVVNFIKTSDSTLYSLHEKVDIKKVGTDLSTYAAKWAENCIVAYALLGKYTTIDLELTVELIYDYHTAFDIKPREVVCNVDLDMTSI